MPANLADIPFSSIAAWPLPNYDNPEGRRTWLVPIGVVLQVLTSLLVALRLFMRGTRKSFGWDDVFIVPAYLFALAFTVLGILGTLYYGLDRHQWDVHPENYWKLALIAWLAEITFLFSTTCTKVSVLLFYRRLTHGSEIRRWRWCVWAAIAFTVASSLACVLVLLCICQPVSAYWRAYDFTDPSPYRCISIPSLNYVAGGISVASDLIAVILPIAMLRNFDVSRRQRIGLNCLFSLGLIICAVGSLRTYWHGKLGYDYDLAHIGYDAFFWSLLEMQLALICATIPVLRSFYRLYIRTDPTTYTKRSSASPQTVSTRHLSGPYPIDTTVGEKWQNRRGSRESTSEKHELESVSTRPLSLGNSESSPIETISDMFTQKV